MQKNTPSLLSFKPAIRNYVWGGRRLLALADPDAAKNDNPIAEVWALFENNPVKNGAFAGQTLAELILEYPEEILGSHVAAQGNKHFPLLIKLLDCERWLSLQVHPDDEQARQLEGRQFSGKTEAWHILNAQSGAQLIAGIKPNINIETLHSAVGNEGILDLVNYHNVQTGDTFFMPAGTIHALGRGLLVYEVQQTSDLTYRVFDWNRPQTNGRVLHIEKSIAVIKPKLQGEIIRQKNLGEPTSSLVQCPYFNLEILSAPQERDTLGKSFHALTVISGEAHISAQNSEAHLQKFDTILVSAVCGTYHLNGKFQILCSSISG